MSEKLFEQSETPVTTALVEHSTEPADVQPLVAAIQTALDRPDIDPERLRQLMDIYNEAKRDEAQRAYNVAMRACQEELPSVSPDGFNKHTKSAYPKLESLNKVAKPIYTKHGFSFSYGNEDCPLPNHVRVICDCSHDRGHTRKYRGDFPYDTVGPQGTQNKTPIQGVGSTISYARRYLKMMILDMTVAGDDDDGQSAAKITEEQIATLNEWIENTETDLKRFLKWLAVESLAEMSADQFNTAMFELKRKASKR